MSHEPNNRFTNASPASIDLIGTLATALMTLMAPFSTALSKRFSPRLIVFFGSLMFLLANIFASFSHQLWQFELSQGILLGFGTCFVYMPTITVAPPWYKARRGLALGIITSGTGIGGLVWAPALRALNAKVGFRNSLRISGLVSGTLVILASTVIEWDSQTKLRLETERRANPRQKWWKIPLVDWRIARTRGFAAHLFGSTMQAAAYYTPAFFFSSYARTLGYTSSTGANFIAINNACNAVGKISIGMIADRFGRVNTLVASTTLSALSVLAFWLPSTFATSRTVGSGLFITYTLMYGIFASSYIALFSASLVELFGPANFAAINGFLYMARGAATLIGNRYACWRSVDTNFCNVRSDGYGHAHRFYWKMTLLVSVLLSCASAGTMWAKLEEKRSLR